MTTPLDAYRPPVVVTDHAWHVVRHPDVPGVTTYYRDRAEAVEHAQRLYVACGRLPFVTGADQLP